MNTVKSSAIEKLSGIMPKETAIFEVNQLFIKHFGSPFAEEFSQDTVNAFNKDIEARLCGRPLQYILGEWEFYSLPFWVGEGVLVPRPDTETLIDCVLDSYKSRYKNKPIKILDLCSGSGCIAVALDKNIPLSEVTALEKEPSAFGFLEKNIALNKSKVNAVFGDVFSDWVDFSDYDIIVSNPPYIPTDDISSLSAEVKNEPFTALDGGKDGLDFYRCICKKWKSCLKPGGMLAVEIGIHQEKSVVSLFEQNGFLQVDSFCDLQNIPRVIRGFSK